MRARSSIVVCFALLTACGSSSQPAQQGAAELSSVPVTPPSSSAPAAVGDTRALQTYLDGFRRASDEGDQAALERLYASDAEIIHHGDDPALDSVKDLAFELFDGPMREVIVRGMENERSAVVEWVYGGAHPGGPIGIRGASVLTFGAHGEVVREVRYFDSSNQWAQIGGGFRACLPFRPLVDIPAAAARVDAGPAPLSERFLREFVGGTGKPARAIVLSNQFLDADSNAEQGASPEIVRAFENRTTKVGACVSAPTWVACEVERGGTFAKPLLNIKPTQRAGTMHTLVVANLGGGAIKDVVEYAEGWEFHRNYLSTADDGFLSKDQVVDPAACFQ